MSLHLGNCTGFIEMGSVILQPGINPYPFKKRIWNYYVSLRHSARVIIYPVRNILSDKAVKLIQKGLFLLIKPMFDLNKLKSHHFYAAFSHVISDIHHIRRFDSQMNLNFELN